MSKVPAMPMYWDAYLADTTHLTTEEHGAYMLIMGAMWRRDGSVPDNDKDNGRIVGTTPDKWRKIKTRLLDTIPGFHVEAGEITQKKLQKTWENTLEKIEKNRANGAKGGRPKTNKNKDLAKANGFVSVNPNESIPEPEPDKKERDTKVSPKKVRGSRLSKAWNLPKDWGDWAVREGWSDSVIRTEADKFRDYWISKAGKDGTKLDWEATWRNWMRNSKSPKIVNGGIKHGTPSKNQAWVDAFVQGARGSS